MPKHLVLVGAGHAHLTTITAIPALIKRGHRVTVIGPSPYHYYSGMAPGMLAGTYQPQEVRFNVRKMSMDRGALFLQDKVLRINPDKRELALQSGLEISYDTVSFNVGSVIPTDSIKLGHEGIYPVKPIDRILSGRNAVQNALTVKSSEDTLNIMVVGGGPAGVEMAGGLWRLVKGEKKQAVITLVAGHRILDKFLDRVRTLVLRSFTARGIRVLENTHVLKVQDGQAYLDDGSTAYADIIFLAVGVKPSPIFAESGLPTGEDGGLLVNRHLQSVRYPEIFGGGDCVTLEGQPLARVGVYAVRQNPVLLACITASLENKPLPQFDPGSSEFLLILNMGDGKGIFRKERWVWQGRSAYLLKDFIDRRFMRKYQLSGERDEEV